MFAVQDPVLSPARVLVNQSTGTLHVVRQSPRVVWCLNTDSPNPTPLTRTCNDFRLNAPHECYCVCEMAM